MYKAFFEYQESETSHLYKNFINKILDNKRSLHSPNISIVSGDTGLKKIVIMLDILEDFTYELKSSFQSYKDSIEGASVMAGGITSFFEKLNNINGALNQITTKGADFMKIQVWKETEPFKMNFKFSLQTKTNPFIDVYLPATLLCSQTILSPIDQPNSEPKNVVFKTPGVNKNKIQNSQSATKTTAKDRNSSSKILDSFGVLVRNIDNAQQKAQGNETDYSVSDTEYPSDESILSSYNALVHIDYAFIETAKPTWSKERTTSGIPLWCELELTVQSVFSANDSMMGYIYPELTPTDLFSKQGAEFIAGAIGRAVRSKVVNIFR